MARRGGTRYLQVFKGNRGKAARSQLIAYFDGDRTVSYPTRKGDREPTKRVFLKPFKIPLAAGIFMEEKVNQPRYDDVDTYFATFTTDTDPGAGNSFKLNEFISPRAIITTGRQTSGTDDTSKLTGLSYKKYGGKSVSVPFGKGTVTDFDTEEEVFAEIRRRVLAANARNAVALVPGL